QMVAVPGALDPVSSAHSGPGHGPRDPRQAVDLPALPLVRAALRREPVSLVAVRRDERDAALRSPAFLAPAARSRARSLGQCHRHLWISAPARNQHSPEIHEREQGLLWSFRFNHWPDGSAASDLDDANLPGLALAARATSSFPGVFPPAQLRDLDRMRDQRQLSWPDGARLTRAN